MSTIVDGLGPLLGMSNRARVRDAPPETEPNAALKNEKLILGGINFLLISITFLQFPYSFVYEIEEQGLKDCSVFFFC